MTLFASEWEILAYGEIPGFGANVSTSFGWDLSGCEGSITEWGFFFHVNGPRNVLVAVTVDILTIQIPAPSALGVFIFFGSRSRRRV